MNKFKFVTLLCIITSVACVDFLKASETTSRTVLEKSYTHQSTPQSKVLLNLPKSNFVFRKINPQQTTFLNYDFNKDGVNDKVSFRIWNQGSAQLYYMRGERQVMIDIPDQTAIGRRFLDIVSGDSDENPFSMYVQLSHYDLDRDGIHELIVNFGHRHNNNCLIYKVQKGSIPMFKFIDEIVSIDIPETKGMTITDGGLLAPMGSGGSCFYKLTRGRLVLQ